MGRGSDNFMSNWFIWMLEYINEDVLTAIVFVECVAGAPHEEGVLGFRGLCHAISNGRC
jgi:hypothetical protein